MPGASILRFLFFLLHSVQGSTRWAIPANRNANALKVLGHVELLILSTMARVHVQILVSTHIDATIVHLRNDFTTLPTPLLVHFSRTRPDLHVSTANIIIETEAAVGHTLDFSGVAIPNPFLIVSSMAWINVHIASNLVALHIHALLVLLVLDECFGPGALPNEETSKRG